MSGPNASPPAEWLPDDLVLGLDVGGTKLAAGVVRADGRVLSVKVAPSRRDEGPDGMIPRHLELGRDAVAAAASSSTAASTGAPPAMPASSATSRSTTSGGTAPAAGAAAWRHTHPARTSRPERARRL